MKNIALLAIVGVAVLVVLGSGYAIVALKDSQAPPKAAANAVPPAASTPEEAGAAGPNSAPEIELSTTVLDFGTIPNNKPTEGTLQIRNKGGAPLVIEQIHASCGCTLGSLKEKDKTIPPGGEVPLSVVVNPARISSFESTKSITIFCNDPNKKHLSVEVHAVIEPEFSVEPVRFDLDKIQKGEIVQRQIVVRQLQDEPFKDKPFELKSVKPLGSPPGLSTTVALRPETEWQAPGRREYLVDVTLDTGAVPPGRYQGLIDVETSLARIRHYIVPVNGEVVAPYTVAPRPVSLGLVEPGKAQAGTITVSGEQPVEVTDVAISGDGLSVSAAPGPDDKTVLINLSVSPNIASGSTREQITFKVKAGEATYDEQVQVTAVVANNAPQAESEAAAQ